MNFHQNLLNRNKTFLLHWTPSARFRPQRFPHVTSSPPSTNKDINVSRHPDLQEGGAEPGAPWRDRETKAIRCRGRSASHPLHPLLTSQRWSEQEVKRVSYFRAGNSTASCSAHSSSVSFTGAAPFLLTELQSFTSWRHFNSRLHLNWSLTHCSKPKDVHPTMTDRSSSLSGEDGDTFFFFRSTY